MKKLFLFLALFGCLVLALMITLLGSRILSPAAASSRVNAGASAPKLKGATPVLVELFTSEGCSSCPPADEVMARLAKTQPVAGAEIIAMGEHVDYWNHLGWTDPYSSAEFSKRQNDYASAFASDQIYTPQMIVDGHASFVGSDLAKAQEEIAKAVATPKATVEISRAENQASRKGKANSLTLSVSVKNLPSVKPGDNAEVLLALTQDGLSSNVTRGENGGHRLTHAAVVRKLSAIGRIKPEDASFSAAPVINIPGDWDRKSVHVVVFVQEHSSRHVLGAASITLGAE
jgi:hypothetical protein